MIPSKTFNNLPPDKQDRIISTVIKEFGEKGFTGTSINVLIRKLGIAKGSVYQYFGDKKGLFLFVFGYCMDMVKNYLRDIREETASENFFFRLEKTLEAGTTFIRENPEVYRLYVKILSESDIPYRDDIITSIRTYSHDYIKSLIQTAYERDELRDGINPDIASFVIDAVMDKYLQAKTNPNIDAGTGIFHGTEPDNTYWINNIVSIFKKGIS